MGKLYDEMKRTGVTEQQIIERFHVSLANLTEIDYKRIMSALKKTDTKSSIRKEIVMEKNKFIEELFYALSCQLGKEFEMKQKRVWKNNGVFLSRIGY